MIDIDMLIDTHTWQYLLVVSPVSHDGHCYEKPLQQLCPEFSSEFSVLIADYDLEDRRRIKRFLKSHQLLYSVEPLLRSCNDEDL